MPLTPRQETFCRLYAETPIGAAAARGAGYSNAAPGKEAVRLLKNPRVQARIAELSGPGIDRAAAAAADRDAAARALSAKLDPVYEASLKSGDVDGVMQVVELQGRLERHLIGGSTIKARGPRPTAEPHEPGTAEPVVSEQAFDRLTNEVIDHHCTLEAIRRALQRIERFLDPAGEHNLLRRYHRDGTADHEWFLRPDDEADEDGYYNGRTYGPANANECQRMPMNANKCQLAAHPPGSGIKDCLPRRHRL